MKLALEKTLGLLALVALTTGSAMAQADKLPVSRTAGVIDVSLPVNQTTLMALPLVEIVASGTGWTFAKLTIANSVIREIAASAN